MTQTLLNVPGLAGTSAAFKRELVAMSERLEANPDYMAAVMSFETSGTFDPARRNPESHAVGLIQFTKGAAKSLGITRDELALLSATEQLRWVEKYFLGVPAKGRMHALADHYLAVFGPKGMGKPPGFVLYEDPSDEYWQNVKLDWDQDGRITVDEAVAPVTNIAAEAQALPRILVPAGPPLQPAPAGLSPVVAFAAAVLFLLGVRKWSKHSRLSA